MSPLPAAVAAAENDGNDSTGPNSVQPCRQREAIVLLHGFDSSSLEYRRLIPQLERRLEAEQPGAASCRRRRVLMYAIDIFGWGFGARPRHADYGPAGKRAHLHEFITATVMADRPDEHDRTNVTLVGASLGGAVAVDYALHYPRHVASLVLIDAQIFTRGTALGALVPPLDRLGIALLKSRPLRRFANRLAVFDKARYATEDALRVGRLHCLTERWAEASLAFLRSGGYSVSPEALAQLAFGGAAAKRVLLLWGADDEVLPMNAVERFRTALGHRRAGERVTQAATEAAEAEEERIEAEGEREEAALFRVRILPRCGHMPHLEKPRQVADAISDFLQSPR